MIKLKTWDALKNLVDTGQVNLKCVTYPSHYEVYGFDGPFTVEFSVDRSPSDTTDLVDFENNYLPIAGAVLAPTDANGVPMSKGSVTKEGWHFQVQGIEFETAKLGSTHNADSTGTDLGFLTAKFYDANDDELTTQIDITASCVKTEVLWEPTYDIDVIGGELHQSTVPPTDVKLWIIAAPDVPKIYGGSIDFVQGGINLRRLGVNTLRVDGKTAKKMAYDATNHTSKFKYILTHAAGVQHPVHFIYHIFKSATV